jgi:RHS repeat-associated protein
MQGISSKAASFGSPENKFKYNGKEEQRREFSDGSGLEWLDFHARYCDPQLGRWTSIDPLADRFTHHSPYVSMDNNPVLMVDPMGMSTSPIYDQEGNLLGTDDQGLQGDAIVMEKSKFEQGMKHQEAVENDLGQSGLKDDAAKTKMQESLRSLPGRPDYDGRLTLREANDWYRKGSGQPLYVNLSSIDFGTTYERNVDKYGNVNLFLTQSPISELLGGGGLVFGSIRIDIAQNLTVTVPKGYYDEYNFDPKPWGQNPDRWMRNVGTKIGEWNAGNGTKFKIYFYGSNHLATPMPPR